jgi:oligopeptidase B
VSAPAASPGRANWQTVVPHRPGIMILSHVALARYLVRLERRDANPQIVVRAWDTGEEHAIAFPEEAYSLGFDAGYEFDTDVIRYRYSSLTTPTERLTTNLRPRRAHRAQAQDGAERATTRAVLCDPRASSRPAPDGEDGAESRSVHSAATLPPSTARPVPALRLWLLRSPPMPALVPHQHPVPRSTAASSTRSRHVRGGTEKGWRWYMAGKREKKTNTFTDSSPAARP